MPLRRSIQNFPLSFSMLILLILTVKILKSNSEAVCELIAKDSTLKFLNFHIFHFTIFDGV